MYPTKKTFKKTPDEQRPSGGNRLTRAAGNRRFRSFADDSGHPRAMAVQSAQAWADCTALAGVSP